MKRNSAQNTILHVLISELGIEKTEKARLVEQYTNGRSASSADMLVHECQALINFLKASGGSKTPGRYQNDPCNVQRRKILSIAREMRWTIGDKVDWKRLNGWLNQYGYLHKGLNDYKLAELPKLVTQFENLLKSYYANR